MKVENVTVVVRAAGERTEKACIQLLERQVPQEAVQVIHERPFAKAVERNFRIGIEEGRDWTMGLDADLLLFDGAVERLRDFAANADPQGFEFQGKVFDKLLCTPRNGGPHLYRTSLLEKALPLIPEEGVSLRPESYTFRSMAEKGHPFVHGDQLYGLHDVGQYKRDLYRKAFVHARKHQKRVPQLERIYRELSSKDDDLRVALKGLKDGAAYQGELRIDKDFFDRIVEQAMNDEAEKGPMEGIAPIPGLEEVPEELLPPEALTITDKYPPYKDYSKKGAIKRLLKKVWS